MRAVAPDSLLARVETRPGTVCFIRPRRELTIAGLICALLTSALTIDAMARDLTPFDRAVIVAVQRIDLPLLEPTIDIVNAVTNSFWAPLIWGLVFVLLLIARWWLAAAALLTFPAGGFINHAIGVYFVDRTRPDEGEILRTIGDWNAPSFPSGHVMGAVMLYGFLFYLAPRLAHRPLRLVVRAASITLIVTVGFARLWVGAHWPSDVLAAYTLGGLLLVLVIAACKHVEHLLRTMSPETGERVSGVRQEYESNQSVATNG